MKPCLSYRSHSRGGVRLLKALHNVRIHSLGGNAAPYNHRIIYHVAQRHFDTQPGLIEGDALCTQSPAPSELFPRISAARHDAAILHIGSFSECVKLK